MWTNFFLVLASQKHGKLECPLEICFKILTQKVHSMAVLTAKLGNNFSNFCVP